MEKVLRDQGLEPAQLTSVNGGRAVAEALCGVSAFFLAADEILRFKEQLAEILGEESVFDTVRLGITGEEDIVSARLAAREAGEQAGLSLVQTLKIVTVVSELARNIVRYTTGGEILLNGTNHAVRVVAKDRGKGIKDLESILGGTYRSEHGLGKGLIGTRRLMDEFEIETGPGGTTVKVSMHAR